MQNITTKQFQQLTDINLVWNFMTEVYDNRFANGVAAPFFEYAMTSSWMDKSYLHLNRFWMEGEKVVAFVFTESPVTSVFFNLRPGYEALAAELVDYAENNMPDFGEQELVLFEGQEALRAEVERRGYTVAWENVDYIFDFTKRDLNYPLPEGFHFADPLTSDPVKLSVCMWKGFDHEDKGAFEHWDAKIEGEEWTPQRAYNGVISATMAPPPHSTYQYNVIIANEQEEYVCFSGMWFVPGNKLAYMEPLCTIPEYRGRGLAAAALSEHCRRLKSMGAEMMTGGGGEFYKKIGYEDGIHWLHYKKDVSV